MDEGEGSGFSVRNVIQVSRGLPSWGLSGLKFCQPEHGVKGGNECGPHSWPFALSIAALGLALLSCLPLR